MGTEMVRRPLLAGMTWGSPAFLMWVRVRPLLLPGLDQGLDALTVALQKLGVDLAELDLLELVGDPLLQEPAVVGRRLAIVEALPERLDLLHRQLRQPGDLGCHARGRWRNGSMYVHCDFLVLSLTGSL